MRVTISKLEQASDRLTPIFLLIVVAASALLSSPASSAKPIGATVVDRYGNRHDLSDIKIKDRTELVYYVGVERRTAGFDQIDKLVDCSGGVWPPRAGQLESFETEFAIPFKVKSSRIATDRFRVCCPEKFVDGLLRKFSCRVPQC